MTKKPPTPTPPEPAPEPSTKKTRISQTDIPRVSLAQALRVTQALAQYGKQPVRPLDIASALSMSPTSGPFRELCGAAIGYGLTDGGPQRPDDLADESRPPCRVPARRG